MCFKELKPWAMAGVSQKQSINTRFRNFSITEAREGVFSAREPFSVLTCFLYIMILRNFFILSAGVLYLNTISIGAILCPLRFGNPLLCMS